MKDFPTFLIDGYNSFMSGRYVDERERYRTLAELGQSPTTMIIACSDSRSAPETIFNVGPGELFVVRNVANLAPPYQPDGHFHATSAAIEFAVAALKVSDIVVMGHGRCGGIRAALDPQAAPLSAGDFIGRWMSLVAPAADHIKSNGVMNTAERQTALERVSVRNSINNLRTFPDIHQGRLRGNCDFTAHGLISLPVSSGLWMARPVISADQPPSISRFAGIPKCLYSATTN